MCERNLFKRNNIQQLMHRETAVNESPTSWFSHARIYHIMLDRFNGERMTQKAGNEFCGGTIRGITQKIQYIKDLGYNCIWISPFYESKAYHGYHITNYEKCDEHFGTIDDLTELCHEAHSSGINVIADFVPNHCSIHHPFFVSAINDQSSKYITWFNFTSWPREYTSFLEFQSDLAKLNLRNPETRSYFIENALFWLQKGIDGFRIDHVIGIPKDFLQALSIEIKAHYPSAVLIGEAWSEGIRPRHFATLDIDISIAARLFGPSQENIQQQYINILDGVLDFESRNIMLSYARKTILHKSSIKQKLAKHFKKYPPGFHLVQFLDNHDTNRIMFECNNQKNRVDDLLALLDSLQKPLSHYYNTESHASHETSIHTGQPFADLHVRKTKKWE
jgi:glycosidase